MKAAKYAFFLGFLMMGIAFAGVSAFAMGKKPAEKGTEASWSTDRAQAVGEHSSVPEEVDERTKREIGRETAVSQELGEQED